LAIGARGTFHHQFLYGSLGGDPPRIVVGIAALLLIVMTMVAQL